MQMSSRLVTGNGDEDSKQYILQLAGKLSQELLSF
jgi:hypothetical protein